MGKRLRNIVICVAGMIISTATASKNVPWKDIEASAKLDFLLGSNRAYRCYIADRKTFDFSIGPVEIGHYKKLEREFNEKGKSRPPEESIIGFEYETIEKGKRVGSVIRDWALLEYISPPPNQIGHKATISLSGGESLTFELFSPAPEWPFTTRERLKPYFYLYRDGQKLKCGGVKQLD